MNIAAAGGAAAVAGAHGSATGSQAGRDAAIRGADGPRVRDGWWARLRKRGAIVAFATVAGALAAIASLVIMIMIAGGWTP